MPEAFNVAWSVAKMPFIPGSVKEKDDGDFVGDFYDPVDRKTRPINIQSPKAPTNGGGRMATLAGLMGGGVPTGTVANMPLDEDERREPEQFFGRNQQEPFALLTDNRTLDRLFVPSHLRRRGIGTALVDALDEWKEKNAPNSHGWPGIRPDADTMTEDALRLFHSRGHLPRMVFPRSLDPETGEPEYWGTRWGGRFGRRPLWSEKGDRGDESFEEGFRMAQEAAYAEYMAGKEKNEIYERCSKLQEANANRHSTKPKGYWDNDENFDQDEYEQDQNAMWSNLQAEYESGNELDAHWGGDAENTCRCWLGHPDWEPEQVDYEDQHEAAEQMHEELKHKFPYSWKIKEIRQKWVNEGVYGD